MCGIAGLLAGPSGAPPSRTELAAMIGRLDHRGPDGTGFHLDGPAGLAHARLSIIDLSTGDQPIHNEDRTVWVVFNGEIFNYLELREALERAGHRFYTHSDTEVIVHLYEQHGEDFVLHLNGQFAIALWDMQKRQLVLARDRAGIRPLFYAEAAGRLAFASEVKALFALPEVPRRLDRVALAEACTYWAAWAPRTTFEGVHALPPGHVMVVGEGGARRVSRYWDWQFPSAMPRPAQGEEAHAEALRELLIDAVRLQLRADVPVGAYLSGGLDSSIITTLIRHYTSTPLRTFSLAFEDAEFDESAWQRELADFLGTDHTSITCRRGDIARAFPRAVRHAEATLVRTAPAPMMLLAGHVRASGFKVVLTGEGADEVFGGYDLFKEAKIRRFAAAQAGSASRPRLLERLYPYLAHSPAGGKAFTESFFMQGMEHLDAPWFAHLPRWSTTGRIARYFSPGLRAEVAGFDPLATAARHLPAEARGWLPMGRDQYVEAHTLLAGYLLSSQGDRMGMAHSIEGRYPFLDHRVIEFGNALPPHWKLKGLNEKSILKKAMKGLLPERHRTRVKQPYRAPDSASFFEQGQALPYVAELFSAPALADAGYFDPVATGRLYEKCRAGRAIGFADNMAFVSVLSTMILHEELVKGRAVDATAGLPVAA